MPSDTSLLHFPVLAATYLHARRRQAPDWTYRQASTNALMKIGLHKFAAHHVRPSLSLRPWREGKRFVLIEPADSEVYTGMAVDDEIQPETIGGTWYPKLFTPDTTIPDNQHVVLHLHGGSFILGDGRTASCGFLAKTFLRHTPAHSVFCPQYRLASSPEGRFPAQLQDTISAYAYLVHSLRIPASRIILSGDSSGGNLVLGLLRYILDYDDLTILPVPKCNWVWSPWNNMPGSMDTATWNSNPNYKTECIPASFPAWGAKNVLGNLEITEEVEKYVTPIRYPFPLPSPILIVAGGGEVLCQEHRDLAEVFRNVPQNESAVEIFVEDQVPHDILMIAWIMGFRKEARHCAEVAGEFVKRLPKAPEA
ncbi:uncharacterized protein N7459_000433 [Penicillium hispanicum]|uniref:uncharacterized protein n=1 Tax=Penicillium hispanicum TaxID=1080232 RepID=UPI002540ECCE|nr:uncharacterized protein N7459_000433 [Penicillium hispanicum]KAJ5594225.1 hypothetical protein N7459_000433 [Penicillium hispanicum]